MAETPNERARVDAGRLWAGGGATALVAALVAAAGIVVARGILGIPVIVPEGDGTWGSATLWWYAAAAAFAALVATALVHVLILTAPRPLSFFAWVMGIATVIAVAVPFVPSASLDTKIATAIINGLIGIAIGTLLTSVARSAVLSARFGAPPSPLE